MIFFLGICVTVEKIYYLFYERFAFFHGFLTFNPVVRVSFYLPCMDFKGFKYFPWYLATDGEKMQMLIRGPPGKVSAGIWTGVFSLWEESANHCTTLIKIYI